MRGEKNFPRRDDTQLPFWKHEDEQKPGDEVRRKVHSHPNVSRNGLQYMKLELDILENMKNYTDKQNTVHKYNRFFLLIN